jgi:hypothetical protein
MRAWLAGAIYRAHDARWQLVPPPSVNGGGATLRGLKARGLIDWLHAPGACWVLTPEGEQARQQVREPPP